MDRTKVTPKVSPRVSPKASHCVEALALKGCTAIWRIIEDLEQGKEVEETAPLSEEERAAVLAELKSIMAVYQGRK
jgi:hypothetical protein